MAIALLNSLLTMFSKISQVGFIFKKWHLFFFQSWILFPHWLHSCQVSMIEKAKQKASETAEPGEDEGDGLNEINNDDEGAEEEIPIEWDPDSPSNVG